MDGCTVAVMADPVILPEMPIELPTFTCKVCGHSWHPIRPKVPLRCAKCTSPYWFRDQAAGKTLKPALAKIQAPRKKG